MVSIIVPVYNAENCLGYCISSVLRQTYKDIELILVDDGSTDNSLKICNNYKEIDSRVRIISIPNGGPGNARNVGIEAANGEAIMFADSDDYMAPDMVQTLYEKSRLYSKDLVVCGMNTVIMEGQQVKSLTQCKFDAFGNEVVYDRAIFLENLMELIWKSAVMEAVWNKIYRTDILKKEQIKFPVDTYYGEDFLFNLAYFRKCNGVVLINKALYYYIVANAESLSQKYKKDMFNNQMRLMQELKKMLIFEHVWKKNDRTLFYNSVLCHGLNSIGMLYHEKANLDVESIKKELANICNNELLRKSLEKVNYIPKGTGYIVQALEKCDVDAAWWNGMKWFVEGIDLEECNKQLEELKIGDNSELYSINPGIINKGMRLFLRIIYKISRSEKVYKFERSLYNRGIKHSLSEILRK